MEITQALEWLDSHISHESTSVGVAAGNIEGLSLEPMVELMSVLGDPQDAVPIIHVTGTNGKGSVASMAASLLEANGFSVGTYSSPHISVINERLTRNRLQISDEELAEVLSGIAAVEELLSKRPTWFEIVTAAAFRWFAEAPVDAAVIEVGLLGRYDATNVANADVAVVTSIGGDHTEFADGWEQTVATEKAGIITPGSPAVIGDVDPYLVDVFVAEGAEPVLASGRDFGLSDVRLAVGGRVLDTFGPHGGHHGILLPLHGDFQARNAAVAIEAVEQFVDRSLAEDVIEQGFAEVLLPGRVEVVAHQPLVVLDGAHNPDALSSLAGTLDEDFTVLGSRVVVLAMMAGRDLFSAAEAVGGIRPDVVICTTVPGGRSVRAEDLAAACEEAGLPTEMVADPYSAIASAFGTAADEDLVLVCGSFHLLAAAREVLAALSASSEENDPDEEPEPPGGATT